MLRYLFAIVLVLGLSSVARAGGNFQMVVVDPPSYVDIITSPDLTVGLDPCVAGQVPHGHGDPSYDGCFTGLNDTGETLTSLELLIPVITGFTPTCTDAPGSIFTVMSCDGKTPDGKDYIIDFSGGPGIPTATDCDGPGGGSDGDSGALNSDDFNASCNADTIFTIAESGAPSSDFTTVSVIGVEAPEPGSLWLLSTGVLSVGLFATWRRRTLCRTRG